MKMEFRERIHSILGRPLTAVTIETLQVNLGYRCNMACSHCHVDAGPARYEQMGREEVEAVLSVLREGLIPVLDITGGAPELNPNFKFLVTEAGRAGVRVIARTNLTVFFEEGMEDLYDFFSGNVQEVVASLPCCSEENVDTVRGKGTFWKSIEAIGILNSLGYGHGNPQKMLNLVYNPPGTLTARPQCELEGEYRKELAFRFGLSFDTLFTFSNMPIGRFRSFLDREGAFEKYMERLSAAFNPRTLSGLMCGRMINVGWDGVLHDCDFNNALGLGVDKRCKGHIRDFDCAGLSLREIMTADHCYGCTAGEGSS
jgi:radical SAM/Cys-rich protein